MSTPRPGHRRRSHRPKRNGMYRCRSWAPMGMVALVMGVTAARGMPEAAKAACVRRSRCTPCQVRTMSTPHPGRRRHSRRPRRSCTYRCRWSAMMEMVLLADAAVAPRAVAMATAVVVAVAIAVAT
eukprot:5015853-Prymnesium_polylepis.1